MILSLAKQYGVDMKLNEVINEIANLPNEEKQFIKGKYYTTVDKRLQSFRRVFGSNARITTEIVYNDLERVVVKATVYIYQDGQWVDIGNDFAEEFRNQGMVNKNSALENCCTSAIGRALANCGLGGGEYASSFEVDNAINNKESAPDLDKGFVVLNHKAEKIAHANNVSDYLNELRKVLSDPKNVLHQKIYLQNDVRIKNAYNNSNPSSEEATAFEKLIKAYE